MGPFGVGRTFDNRYLLRREIARGGMGMVYEAEQLYTGCTVALKVLNPEHEGARELRERLLREARVLGTVRSPGVV